jgi:hypothetical protein
VRDEPLPPTQIGRALSELAIGWIAAYSLQAKGRVERSFETDQDRLVKGLRVAGVKTLEQANAYLDSDYLPEWDAKFTVVPACADDAHRPLGAQHELGPILSEVRQRVITNDYTIRHDTKILQILREDIQPRMRGAPVRVEVRRTGEIAVRFEGRYVRIEERLPAPKANAKPLTPSVGKNTAQQNPKNTPPGKSNWMNGFWERPARSLNKAIKISNATS